MKKNDSFAAMFSMVIIFGIVFYGCKSTPAVAETPKPPVEETPKPLIAETPKPAVEETPEPPVEETPKPLIAETPPAKQFVTKKIIDGIRDKQELTRVQYYIDEKILLSTGSPTRDSRVTDDGKVIITNDRKVEKIELSKGIPVISIDLVPLKINGVEIQCLTVCFESSQEGGEKKEKTLYFRPGMYQDRYPDGYYLVDERGDKIKNGDKISYGDKSYFVSVLSGDGTNWPYLLCDVTIEKIEAPIISTPEGRLVTSGETD
jgi:hypothetical protein